MSQHYKKLGFKTPKNYFQKSKNEILASNFNNENILATEKSSSYFQLLVAAIFITSLLYMNFPNNSLEINEFRTDSPIISTILSNSDITDEYIIDFLTSQVVVNEINIPK